MKRCLVLVLLLAAVLPLRGQDYDAALDRFAAITNECQRLKARIEEGETVEEAALKRLMAELNLLQKELQGDSRRSMTSAQQERYRLILACYREGKMVPASALQAATLQTGLTAGDTAALSHPESHPEGPPAGRGFRGFVTGTASWPLEGGLAAGFMRPQGFWGGAIFRLSGNARYPRWALDAASDGSSGSGFIWTSGNARSSRFTATVDAILRPLPAPVGLYVGAGYGFSRTFWQTTEGAWARITDQSVSGPAVDLGILCARGHLILSAGATTLAFRTVSGTVGLGYRF